MEQQPHHTPARAYGVERLRTSVGHRCWALIRQTFIYRDIYLYISRERQR
jgi:hypothetical protein